jgi:hypothetical protein
MAAELSSWGFPRFIYHSQIPNFMSSCTYCGPNDPWSECNPERCDIDGPIERLAHQGVQEILAADLTVGGVLFSKPFDILTMGRKE